MRTASNIESTTRRIRLVCLAIIVLLGIGLWANMPYVLAEHRRLEPWKIVGLWSGDLVALLWFARFAFTHGLKGDPLTKVSVSDGRRQLRWLAMAGMTALFVDLAFTLNLLFVEKNGYARGVIAEAEVLGIQVHKRPAATSYDLECRFKDTAHIWHEAHLRILASGHEFPSALSTDTISVVTSKGKEPGIIRIRYDPQFPTRAWIDGLGWNDENGLFWFSLGVLLLQTGATVLLMLFLVPYSSGYWPWWWETHKVLPLATEVFCMLMMGLIDRLMDSLA